MECSYGFQQKIVNIFRTGIAAGSTTNVLGRCSGITLEHRSWNRDTSEEKIMTGQRVTKALVASHTRCYRWSTHSGSVSCC